MEGGRVFDKMNEMGWGRNDGVGMKMDVGKVGEERGGKERKWYENKKCEWNCEEG